MSVFIEPAVSDWLRSVLVADATLLALLPNGAGSVFGSDPIQGATRPYLVIQMQAAGAPLRVVGPTIFWEDFVHLVKAVGQPHQRDAMVAIIKRTALLLEMQSAASFDGVRIVSAVYEGAFDPPADEYAGTLTKQIGAFWRTYGQAIA